MLLYIIPLIAALSCTVAVEDATGTADSLSHCLKSDVAGSPECLGVDRPGSFINDHENKPKADLKVIHEINGIGNEMSVSASEKVESERIAQSSQQATELLVSSWNDLRQWTKRNDTSSVCEQDVERAITGFIANEMWALQLFDAWAKPGPSLLQGRSIFVGNYYQCRDTRAPEADKTKKARLNGNYCVVTFTNLTNTYSSNMFVFVALSNVQLGTCLPDTCSEVEITRLFQEKLEKLNVATYLQAVATDCRSEDREYTKFTVVSIIIVLVIGTLAFFGTALDVIFVYFPNCTSEGVLVKILLSFSAYTNGRRLLSTSQAPGSISVIPGIRFLNMSWIVVGHTFSILIYYGLASNVAQGMTDLMRSRAFDVLSTSFGVDSFFTISGFLVSYLTIKQVTAKGWRFNWSYFYLHRYWRLTPTLVVTIVMVEGLQRFAVSGSNAPTSQPRDKTACENNWWFLPLYITNLVGLDFDKVCFAQSWSLSADFQFYLLSPLMMIPFYYHKFAGILSCLIFVIGQWIIAGVFSYQTNGAIGLLGISMDWLRYCYFPFYSRIGPFAIGMLSGYILSANNGRVQMKPSVVITGWILATAAAIIVVFGFHGDMSREFPSSLLVATIFNAVSKSVWGASVSWVIIACSSGYGGPVNAFLSWPPFTVLGRLTYIGYLIQMSVSTVVFENLEQPINLNLFSMVVFGTVNVFFTCVVSAILVIFLELPTFNLEKVFQSKKVH